MCDYLHRRAGSPVYQYRRRIPEDLRRFYKNKSEFYFSLRTSDLEEAKLRAQEQGAQHTREFLAHRQRLSSLSPQDKELEEFNRWAENPDNFPPRPPSPPLTPRQEYEQFLYEEACAREQALEEARREEALEIVRQRLEAQREARALELEIQRVIQEDAGCENPEGFAELLAAPPVAKPAMGRGLVRSQPIATHTQYQTVIEAGTKAPLLSEIVADFLSRQDQSKAMFKKYKAVLSAFLEVIGDKSCSQLRQKEIDGFFELMCCLPPRWTDEKRKHGVSLKELSEQDWSECISQATFDNGYLGAFRPFLTEARRRYGDQGFPPNLTTDGIKYSGDREAGSQKQRHIKSDELRRMFEGAEMQSFARLPELQHCYWLPLVGLYTGARVNEVCQLNPQIDIREEDGIWFFDFTSKSEGDDRIKKRIKNKGSHRKVPIHYKLIELGLLSYVDEMKGRGHKLLFAQWSPSKGRASAGAERWFRDFLINLGLRDETPEARLVGYHSFRCTFLNYAKNNRIENADWLTGHASEGVSPVVANYQGAAELSKKKEIVDSFDFQLQIPCRE